MIQETDVWQYWVSYLIASNKSVQLRSESGLRNTSPAFPLYQLTSVVWASALQTVCLLWAPTAPSLVGCLSFFMIPYFSLWVRFLTLCPLCPRCANETSFLLSAKAHQFLTGVWVPGLLLPRWYLQGWWLLLPPSLADGNMILLGPKTIPECPVVI